MSLAAHEVLAPTDVFRCLPYKRSIAASACVSSQTAALDGTKSLAKCIGCADGVCVAARLKSAPMPESDELAGHAPKTDPTPPTESKETAMTDEEKRARKAEYNRRYHAKRMALDGGRRPRRKKPGPKPKPRKVRSPADVPPSQRSLTDIAMLLGINVDALIRREIASVLGLEQP